MKKLLILLFLINCSSEVGFGVQQETKNYNTESLLFLISLTKKELGNRILPYDLTWEDFQGTPPQYSYSKNPAGISPRIKLVPDKDGKIDVYCEMNKKESFRQKDPLGKDGLPSGGVWTWKENFSSEEKFWDHVLVHEQKHLEICIVESRAEAKRIFDSGELWTPESKDKIVQRITNHVQKIQNQYDSEVHTPSGHNLEKQREWNEKISIDRNLRFL